MLNIFGAEEYLSQIHVGRQIAADEVTILAKAGFKTIICNRPDGEEALQPDFKDIEQAATKAGIKAIFLPVTMTKLTSDAAAEMAQLLNTEEKPIYAYCRSGGRVKKLCSMIK